MANININNNGYVGQSITVSNGRVIIDGNVIDTRNEQTVMIKVTGDIDKLEVGSANVEVLGNVIDIKTGSGDINVVGEVHGNIQTGSGDVECGNVEGSVKTGSGDITYKR